MVSQKGNAVLWAMAPIILAGFFQNGQAGAEKVRIGTPQKTPHYALPMLAAEEKGVWREEGLDVQWVAFTAGGAQVQAFAAGALDVGLAGLSQGVIMNARRIPVVVVADFKFLEPWYVVVPVESRIKTWADLKGARVSVSRTGSLSHVYSRVSVKALGLEGSVKFVALGAPPQQVAALKAGTAEALASSLAIVANLMYAGQVRPVVEMSKYMPKGDSQVIMIARKGYPKENPEATKKAIRAVSRAGDYATSNRPWAVEKLTASLGYTREAAEELSKVLRYSKDLRVTKESLENIKEFLVTYNLVAAREVPALEEIYSNDYLP